MHFRFDDDQLALRDTVRSWCDDRFDLTRVAAREAGPVDDARWLGLAELGVLGMLAGEPASGLGMVEAAIVFEELGAHLVTGPVLWSTLAAPLVDGVADGSVRVTGVEPDGADDLADGPVVVDHGGEADLVVLLHADRVECVPLAGLEPAGNGCPLDPLTPVALFASVGSGEVLGGAAAARQLRRAGEILSAAMLVGVAQGALDLSRDYALEREQFGVPIGSFQAVKHLLADMYVRVELARAAAYAAAAVAVDPRAGDVDHAAATAKLLAGEAGIANGRWAVQVLGGMGFTWDMLPHYFLKRAWVLEHTFGTAPAHAARLADALSAVR